MINSPSSCGPSAIQSGTGLRLALTLSFRHSATLVANSRGGYGRILENFAPDTRPQILKIHVSLAARLPSRILRCLLLILVLVLLIIGWGHLLRLGDSLRRIVRLHSLRPLLLSLP